MSVYFPVGNAQNSSLHLSVWQTPQDLNIMEGSNARITCNFHYSISGRINVKWNKDNKTIVHSVLIQYKSNTNASSVLELKSLSSNQSGLYICEVLTEIPKITISKGSGTNVTVTGKTAVYFFF